MHGTASLPTLSICIPTFNFGRFIGATLASILGQAGPNVEIIVLDSGSTDETQNIVEGLQRSRPGLRYYRRASKLGIDRDMDFVVSLATGRYCWLFSADDIMADGALSTVLAEVRSGLDVYICQHSIETIDLRPLRLRHPVLALASAESFDLSSPEQQRRYFSLALTTEAFFSFMSTLIVKKAAWDRVPLNEKFVGSCWAHAARLFESMPLGLTVRYVAEPLVRKRGGNDSFNTQGLVRRFAIGILGYQELGKTFFGAGSEQLGHIQRVLRREFRLRSIVRAKFHCAVRLPLADSALLDQMAHDLYSDGSLRSLVTRLCYLIFSVCVYWPVRQARLVRRASPV